MPAEDLKSAKKQVRQIMRDTLLSLPDKRKSEASAHIRNRLSQWLSEHPSIETVASFAHMPIEPDLHALLESLPHIRWVFPRSQAGGIMEFHQITTTAELEPGLYGILQPKASPTTLVDASEIDCFLCPAFAYTLDGKRLGKGGGYYDRLLAKRREDAVLIGVSFQSQVLETIPTEEHDITVDFVVTD